MVGQQNEGCKKAENEARNPKCEKKWKTDKGSKKMATNQRYNLLRKQKVVFILRLLLRACKDLNIKHLHLLLCAVPLQGVCDHGAPKFPVRCSS